MLNAVAQSPHQVVVIGGGFGGLYAAKALGRINVNVTGLTQKLSQTLIPLCTSRPNALRGFASLRRFVFGLLVRKSYVTLIDQRNFHLFQPLLYQVATGTLSPADISSPLRSVLNRSKNTKVLMGEVVDIDLDRQKVILRNQEIPYDSLIVATGISHHYFSNDNWATVAPRLKTVEDALEMRRRIFVAFEAEKEIAPEKRSAWLTFVIVGSGATGVELAGAIAELAYSTLKKISATLTLLKPKFYY